MVLVWVSERDELARCWFIGAFAIQCLVLFSHLFALLGHFPGLRTAFAHLSEPESERRVLRRATEKDLRDVAELIDRPDEGKHGKEEPGGVGPTDEHDQHEKDAHLREGGQFARGHGETGEKRREAGDEYRRAHANQTGLDATEALGVASLMPTFQPAKERDFLTLCLVVAQLMQPQGVRRATGVRLIAFPIRFDVRHAVMHR